MYYKLIEVGKNYIFCDLCGKCYIYRGSYEKHKLMCEKKNDNNFLIEENVIIRKNESNKIENNELETRKFDEDEMDYIEERREKLENKVFNKDDLVEIVCPFYLFFVSLILGFIKGIFCGF